MIPLYMVVNTQKLNETFFNKERQHNKPNYQYKWPSLVETILGYLLVFKNLALVLLQHNQQFSPIH